ncbi:MAG: alpha/beta fold hydrolase [Candidatus Hodarchaeota archaeon]
MYPRSEGVITIEGISHTYVREGSGKPIAVIGSAIYYPKAFSSSLKEQFELVFIDLKHFIPLYNPPKEELEKVTLEDFVDDLEAAREELGLEKPAFLGHSVHAQIALRYAEKYPQHTSHLILLCGVPYSFSEFSKESDEFWDKDASEERKAILAKNLEQYQAELSSAPPSRLFAIYYTINGPKYWMDPNYDATVLLEGIENGVALDPLFASLPSRIEVSKTLENLDMPTLVILGRYDYAIPYTVWEELLEGLDNITYYLIEESSHNPHTEHPGLFDPKLISWLKNK